MLLLPDAYSTRRILESNGPGVKVSGHDYDRVMARAFTLIELLIVVAILALLLAVLLPALGQARAAGQAAICLSNLRQAFLACRTYADEHRGYGPAIGEPYGELPNWGLVVQRFAHEDGTTPAELFRVKSVLVCPAAQRIYGGLMTRTYAMNATGHGGAPGDPDDFDDPQRRGHIHLDRVQRPAERVLLVDAARAPILGDAPPPTRTASVLDFRRPEHVTLRLGWHHQRGRAFQLVWLDGSVSAERRVTPAWTEPLP